MSLTNVSEAVTISRTSRELADLKQNEKVRRNQAIIRSGQAAVARGDITFDNVVALADETMGRHVTLMQLLGFPDKAYDPGKLYIVDGETLQYEVTSRPIRIDRGIFAVLAQRSSGGFEGDIQSMGIAGHHLENGLEPTLEAYATPRTTQIDDYDVDEKTNEGVRVDNIMLGPNSSHNHSVHFREEWGHSMFPFGKAFDAKIRRSDEGLNLDEPRQFTDKSLVVAAGYIATFNRQLDVVDWALDKIPQ